MRITNTAVYRLKVWDIIHLQIKEWGINWLLKNDNLF